MNNDNSQSGAKKTTSELSESKNRALKCGILKRARFFDKEKYLKICYSIGAELRSIREFFRFTTGIFLIPELDHSIAAGYQTQLRNKKGDANVIKTLVSIVLVLAFFAIVYFILTKRFTAVS